MTWHGPAFDALCETCLEAAPTLVASRCGLVCPKCKEQIEETDALLNQRTNVLFVCCVPSYFRADGDSTCTQPGKYQVAGHVGYWVCEWHAVDFQTDVCPACGESTEPGVGTCSGHRIDHDHDGYVILHLHERGVHDRCVEACSKVNR